MRVGIVVPMTTEARTLFEMREFPVRRKLGIWEVHEHQEGDNTLGLMVGGIGMVNAAMSTQALISGWEPDIVALIGCAGGLVEDLLPGDVLIGKTLCCYSSYSTAADGTVNPDILGLRVGTDYTLSEDRSDFATASRTKQRYIHSTPWLVEAALSAGEECRDAFHVWPADIVKQFTTSKFGQRAPRCSAGVIGTADQIHSDPKVIAEIRERWGMDAEECEGVAFGQVALSHKKPFIAIRGISDNEVVDPFLGDFLRSNRSGLDNVEIESTRNAWLVFLAMLKKLR
ncbi:MAG: 5'-methylthioadenosine/S-adenosylhomocysteine nucleosidase [Bacillota bacterium]